MSLNFNTQLKMGHLHVVTVTVSILACIACSCYGELTLQADTLVKTLPADIGQLNSFAFLLCNIQPTNASVLSRWVLPNGDIISNTMDRFITAQGDTDVGFSSLLIVQKLTYRDAGHYTCEVFPIDEDLCTCQLPPSATAELRLLVTLLATEEQVSVSDGAAEVELSCEMRDFIRPDEELEWFKGDTRIHSGTPRVTINYSKGTPNTAQMGSNFTVHSRLSTLTIENPYSTDSDIYSCRIRGTNVSADIQLSVNEDGINQLDNPDLTIKNSPPSTTDNSNTKAFGSIESPAALALIVLGTFACAAILSSLLTVIATCLCLRRGLCANKTLRSESSSPELEWYDANS